jgi:hypothetical protein
MREEQDNKKGELFQEFSKNDIKELNELRKKRLNGESKIYSWTEVKKMIVRKRPFFI